MIDDAVLLEAGGRLEGEISVGGIGCVNSVRGECAISVIPEGDERFLKLEHVGTCGRIAGGDAYHTTNGLVAGRGKLDQHLGGSGEEHDLAVVDGAVLFESGSCLEGEDGLGGLGGKSTVRNECAIGVVTKGNERFLELKHVRTSSRIAGGDAQYTATGLVAGNGKAGQHSGGAGKEHDLAVVDGTVLLESNGRLESEDSPGGLRGEGTVRNECAARVVTQGDERLLELKYVGARGRITRCDAQYTTTGLVAGERQVGPAPGRVRGETRPRRIRRRRPVRVQWPLERRVQPGWSQR